MQIRNPGAQILSWQFPCGRGLYTPEQSFWAESKPVRGGVPIIFPQFNRIGDNVRHGVARQLPWHIQKTSEGYDAQLSLNRAEHAFESNVKLSAYQSFPTPSEPSLTVNLSAVSTASETQAFGGALHTYIFVGDISQCEVFGLENAVYRDYAGGQIQEMNPSNESITFTGEVDRVYVHSAPTIRLHTPVGNYLITHEGFNNVVVWNPGPMLGAQLVDIPEGDWRRFVCIEAAHIFDEHWNRVQLPPKQTWQGQQRIQLTD